MAEIDALGAKLMKGLKLERAELEEEMLAAGYHRPNRGPWRKRGRPQAPTPPESPAA